MHRVSFCSLMMMVRRFLRAVFACKKLSKLLFFGKVCRAFRVQLLHGLNLFIRHLRKMTDEMDQLPAVFIGFAWPIFSESRHSCESDSIVNDVINFPVRKVLRWRQAH